MLQVPRFCGVDFDDTPISNPNKTRWFTRWPLLASASVLWSVTAPYLEYVDRSIRSHTSHELPLLGLRWSGQCLDYTLQAADMQQDFSAPLADITLEKSSG